MGLAAAATNEGSKVIDRGTTRRDNRDNMGEKVAWEMQRKYC